MNCTCIADTEKRLAVFVRDRAGEGAKVECTATAIQLTPELGLRMAVNIPFRVTSPAKGFTKGKMTTISASYCPFCGRSTKHYAVGQDEGLDAAFGFTTTGEPT